jgi:hypothetical protein
MQSKEVIEKYLEGIGRVEAYLSEDTETLILRGRVTDDRVLRALYKLGFEHTYTIRNKYLRGDALRAYRENVVWTKPDYGRALARLLEIIRGDAHAE